MLILKIPDTQKAPTTYARLIGNWLTVNIRKTEEINEVCEDVNGLYYEFQNASTKPRNIKMTGEINNLQREGSYYKSITRKGHIRS